MATKKYTGIQVLEGQHVEIWDFESTDGPKVTITSVPAAFPKSGEFECKMSKDGVYDVIVHHQISKPMAQAVLQIINHCDVEVTSAPASAYRWTIPATKPAYRWTTPAKANHPRG